VKVTCDPQVDVLRIALRDVAVHESDESQPGVILDFHDEGRVVGIEILDASLRVAQPRVVELAVTG